jgi:integrase/recombinase XerD
MAYGRDPCLESFAENLLAAGRVKKTIDAYQSDLQIFRHDVGTELLDVTATDVYRVIEGWQARDVKEATVQRRSAALRQFYNLMYMMGLIALRPTANLRTPKPWRRVSTPAAEDLELVIAAIGTKSPFDVRDRSLLLLLRDSGIRANAIARAELANVDWQKGRIMLRKDKYRKDHWVPLSQRSLSALRVYVNTARLYFLRGRALPYLFVSVRGNTTEPLTRQRIWQIADQWTMKVLGVRYSPHAWRRTVLTEGAEDGMDVFDLMQMAGHLSPETTQRYINHSNVKLREIFYRSHPRAGKGKVNDSSNG